jgi:hypothetical protein
MSVRSAYHDCNASVIGSALLFDFGYVGPAVSVRAVGRRADFIERGLVTKFAAA